ncbi:MAG: alpha/beta fold hydrolase [Nakamurella sp.]
MSAELLIEANGVQLCAQTFGAPTDPTILLIGGTAASMDWWEDDFCRQLAAGGRFVIRYDHRDTGRSVSYPAGSPGYSGTDLVNDAVGILDALGRPTAHIVGISMGGALAQVLTLDNPSRVQSLTIISSTAGAGDPDLPGMDDDLEARFAALPDEPDWSDRPAVVEYLVQGARPYAATSQPFDSAAVRRVVEKAVDRTTNNEASSKNHPLAEGGGSWRHRLGEITVPVLVLHGDEDQLFPLPHGRALATEIPNARLVILPATGHELPQRIWDLVVTEVLRLTSPNWQTHADVLAERFVAADDPTGWFDELYGAASRGTVTMPWDHETPQSELAQWMQQQPRISPAQTGTRKAVVVGCGLGADAEFLARHGYDTTAFDISSNAIALAKARHPESPVHYQPADLFDLPDQWSQAFDLVVEIYTVQALPLSLRAQAGAAVAGLVAPGGSLLAIQVIRPDNSAVPDGPPWPLTRAEIDNFAVGGLRPVHIEQLTDAGGVARWRAEFVREAAGTMDE